MTEPVVDLPSTRGRVGLSAGVRPDPGGGWATRTAGALQTGQRIGASIGAAVLMTAYQLTAGPASAGTALQIALLTGIAVLALALLMAVQSLRQERVQQPSPPAYQAGT